MTTEQCSVDSILAPTSHTETFARQLQNRLRTLNNEIDRDGHEETSWNGDQLSSSSDDIYYDLDSYPGSPAEEATESNFRDFINGKPPDNTYSTPSTNSYLNHENTVNHYQNINNAQTVFSNKPESGLICYDYHTSASIDINTSLSNDRLNSFPYQNGFHPPSLQNNTYLNGNSDEQTTGITGMNHTSYSERTEELSETSKPYNCIKDRLQCNGQADETTYSQDLNESEIAYFHESEGLSNLGDCSCCPSVSESRGIDFSRNSLANHIHNNCTITAKENGISESDRSTLITSPPTNENLENKKDNYTEEDLCRLVDAVFLKSEENNFDEHSCEEDKEDSDEVQHTGNVEEEETIESKRSKFRRSSSLKTGKTPPGTPGHKKIVRFADVLGLDLADVRTFLDEIPKVPKSAFTDLKNVELSSSPPVNMLESLMGHLTGATTRAQRTIVPLFQQPSSRLEFLDRVRDFSVCLENAVVTDPTLSVITGYVRVKNIDFHKSVHIRYSIDNWKSFADLQAKYVPNSWDGFSDKFTFVLYAHMLNVGQRLEFAVRYHVNGNTFWDNNLGANYTLQCVPEGPSRVLPTETYAAPRSTATWGFY